MKIELKRDWQVRFDHDSSFRDLLGFQSKVVTESSIGRKRANFLTVSEYVVHCNMVDARSYSTEQGDAGSYVNGMARDYLYVLPVKDTAEINQKVVYDKLPPLPVPLRKTKEMYELKLWITDQDDNLVDFNGYEVSFCVKLI